MEKKEAKLLKELIKTISDIPPPAPNFSISHCNLDMNDGTDMALAEAAGKVADCLTAIANRNANSNRYGVYVEASPKAPPHE